MDIWLKMILICLSYNDSRKGLVNNISNEMIAITDGNEIEINVADADSSVLNEIQSLSLDFDTLSISGGNKVLLPSKWDGTDSTIYTLKQVGIGTNSPDSSAILDLQSTSKGFLPPKMTKAHNNNVVNPSVGFLIYRTDTIPLKNLKQGGNHIKLKFKKIVLITKP